MPLIPDPCFIESIRRASGSKRVLVHVANANPNAVEVKISNVTKPEWIDVEQAMIGDTLSFRKGGKLPMIININTDHRFFPDDPSLREEIKFEFEDADDLTVYIYLQEIITEIPEFRGTFSIDFGTSNTCYAWKRRVGDDYQMSDALKPPEVSREVPTLVRFKDISNRDYPSIEIGNHARDYIAHNSGKNFTYQISVKRLMGQDKDIVILDERSGLEADRFQKYKPHEIAAFILREFIRDAEQNIGEKLNQVVATFPVLYNERKLSALRQAFAGAFKALNREWNDDMLVIRLDETNAAAFNYIYGQLLDEFRRFTVQQKQHRIVSYDFGGGTVDVSVVDIDLTRDQTGRIKVGTQVLGVTGDRYFGGDNITLAVAKTLKLKLALKAAKVRKAEIDAERAAAAKAEEEKPEEKSGGGMWDLGAMAAASAAPKQSNDAWGDLGGGDEDEEAPAEEAVVEEAEDEDPETADVVNLTAPDKLEQAIEDLVAHAKVIEYATQKGLSLAASVKELAANGVLALQPFEVKETVQRLEDSINALLPTCWKTLEDSGDLITKDVAKKLFYELWLPAEVMKIRAVTDQSRTATLTEPLHKIAKYAGVRADDLMGVTVTEAEINAAIDKPLRRSIAKAAYLTKSVDDSSKQSGGLNFGIGATGAEKGGRQLTVLLAGNSSRLPVVRKVVEESFGLDAHSVVMDPNGVKATVAQGACEEHILRRDFGTEGGLIEYDAGDFTTRLPYSIGLFHKELSLIGFAGGFAPVMNRGTEVDTQVLLTEALQIVHKDARELTVFAYYHDHELGNDSSAAGAIDGVEPYNLGWFDLTKPAGKWEQPFAADVQMQLMQDGDSFKLVLFLDQNRDLTLINPATKDYYTLRAAPELCLDSENPFSGTH